MTSTEMLARCRTILDESSASFWTDAEIYSALADGQNQVIDKLLTSYRIRRKTNPSAELPYELQALGVRLISSGAASFVTIPTGYLELVYANWDHDNSGTKEPCEIVTPVTKNQRQDNSYTSATSTEPVVFMEVAASGGAVVINFLPVYSTTGVYDLQYLDKPTDIAAGVNAELPVNTHSAIVHYAVSRMFDKDQRPQDSQMHYGLFVKEIEGLL